MNLMTKNFKQLIDEQVPLYLHHCQQMQQQKLVVACHKDSFLQMA